MSGAWDGTRVLRCVGGPWADEERVWVGEDLVPPGINRGRYVATPLTEPEQLTWLAAGERLGRGRWAT